MKTKYIMFHTIFIILEFILDPITNVSKLDDNF